jgi:pimeloyl-ACP methyl ester carboxylesterase
MRSAASLLALVLALAVAGAWATDWRAERRELRAEALWPPEGRFIEVEGRRVHAVTRGQGPDVVLIHGASGNTRDMTFDLMDLLAVRYRVTAFDRPGLGYTEAAAVPGESPMEQARLLHAAARELGIERPIVLGHSFGGAVALAWALGDPEGTAAVVDVSGVAMPWPGRLNRLYRIMASGAGQSLIPSLVAAWAPDRLVEQAVGATFAPNPIPEGYTAHFGSELSIRRASFRENARQVNALRGHIVEMSQRYDGLTMPIEIVHGDADTIVPLEVHSIPLSRIAPNAHLVVLPGVGHMPHHTAPEEVVAAVDRARRRAGP